MTAAKAPGLRIVPFVLWNMLRERLREDYESGEMAILKRPWRNEPTRRFIVVFADRARLLTIIPESLRSEVIEARWSDNEDEEGLKAHLFVICDEDL